MAQANEERAANQGRRQQGEPCIHVSVLAAVKAETLLYITEVPVEQLFLSHHLHRLLLFQSVPLIY